MLELDRHDQVPCGDDAQCCVICPYSEIRLEEVDASDDEAYSQEIFDDDADVALGVYDAAVCLFFFCDLIIQRIRRHPSEDMHEGFPQISEEAGDVSSQLFGILDEELVEDMLGMGIEYIDIGHQ